jgi:hypothetical protein
MALLLKAVLRVVPVADTADYGGVLARCPQGQLELVVVSQSLVQFVYIQQTAICEVLGSSMHGMREMRGVWFV